MSMGILDADTVVLAELRPFDPVAGAEAPVYLATRDVTLPADDPDAPNREYLGLLANDVALGREMFAGGVIGGSGGRSRAAVKVVLDDASVDEVYAWRGWAWDRRPAALYAYRIGQPYASRTPLWVGVTTGEADYGRTTVTLVLADQQERLSRRYQSSTYGGTGGFDGGADLKDQPKPEVLGQVWGVTPVEVDGVNLWYDLDPVSGLSAVAGVFVGANALTVSASNPPPAGHVYIDLAAGRIRLGMRPDAPLTVHCTGAAAGGATTVGALVAAVQGRAGVTAFDTAAYAAMDADSPFATGYYAREGEAAADICNALLTDVGLGFGTTTRTGLATVGRVVAPTATSADDAAVKLVITDADILPGSLVVKPVPAPPSAVDLGWRRNWTVHGADDLRGNDAAAQAFALAAYRRTAVDAPAGLLAAHPDAEPYRPDTGLAAEADAIVVRDRVAAVVCAERWFVDLEIASGPLVLELADQVWVQSDLYRIDAAFRVVGIPRESSGALDCALRLWR